MVPEMRVSFATDLRSHMAEGELSMTPAESCCRMWGPLANGAFLLSYPDGVGGSRTGYQFQPWFNMAAGSKGYYATQGDSYSINAYDPEGHLVRIIRLAGRTRCSVLHLYGIEK